MTNRATKMGNTSSQKEEIIVQASGNGQNSSSLSNVEVTVTDCLLIVLVVITVIVLAVKVLSKIRKHRKRQANNQAAALQQAIRLEVRRSMDELNVE